MEVLFHFPSRPQYLGQNLWQDCVQGRLAKIRTPEHWNFNGHAAACVIAQQYSSACIVALRIHPDKAKLGATFQHVILVFYFLKVDRSQWPRCLRRGSPAARLLGLWVQIPPGHGCLSLASVVCCQGDFSASGWSPVQRSPTECGVSESDHESSIMRTWPIRVVVPW